MCDLNQEWDVLWGNGTKIITNIAQVVGAGRNFYQLSMKIETEQCFMAVNK